MARLKPTPPTTPVHSNEIFILKRLLFQHAPTNKLLYAKDIPQFKLEVKEYYKCVREQQPVTTAEFKDFLLEESKVCFDCLFFLL